MKRAAAWLALASWLSGCSWLGPWTQAISVSSDPAGATVVVNGKEVGKTPLETKIRRPADLWLWHDNDLLIEVHLEGYETEYPQAHRSMSTLGIVDTFLGAVVYVPWLGLLSPAAWKYEPAAFGVNLTPRAETNTDAAQ